jgi:DNA-binding NtrC family response regulator
MAKILIADDDAEMRAVLNRSLAALGHEVAETTDGTATLASARAQKPDIVLLDIFMPKLNGISVLKELAAELPGTGFIMITGNEDEDVARECLKLGAFDYVTKPINLDVLRKTIDRRLKLLK